MEIMKQKTQWQDESIKLNFQSGLELAIVVFEILFGLFPSRIQKFAKYIGLNSFEKLGEDKIFEIADQVDNVFSNQACLGIIFLYLYASAYRGSSRKNLMKCNIIFRKYYLNYPKVIILK